MRSGRWRRWLLAIPLLLPAAVGGYLAWATVQNAPLASAEAALTSDGTVAVASYPRLVFRPVGETPSTGLIFYPDGLVPPANALPSSP